MLVEHDRATVSRVGSLTVLRQRGGKIMSEGKCVVSDAGTVMGDAESVMKDGGSMVSDAESMMGDARSVMKDGAEHGE